MTASVDWKGSAAPVVPPLKWPAAGQSAEGTGDSSDARSAVLLQDHDARGGRGHHPTGLWCARLKVSPLLPSLLSLLPASLTRWHSRARALKASGLILNFWLWQVTSSPRVTLDVVCRKEAGLFELSSLSGECTHATPPPVARVPGWRYRSPAPPPL
jgi:hypothetical protein